MRRSSGRISLLAQLSKDDVSRGSKRIKYEDTELIRLAENYHSRIAAKIKLWDDLLCKYASLNLHSSESDEVYFDMFDAYYSIFSDQPLIDINVFNEIHKLELKDADKMDDDCKRICTADGSTFDREFRMNRISKEKITAQAAEDLDREIPAVSLLSTVEIVTPTKMAANQLVVIKNEMFQLEHYIVHEKCRLLTNLITPVPILLKECFALKRQLINNNL